MKLLKDLINESLKTVSRLYPEREAREMVFILLEHCLGTKRHTHIMEPMYEVSEEGLAEVEKALKRIGEGEPLQYVTGTASFYGREFHVDGSVLIPRPETEILCRLASEVVRECKYKDILDMCTGSGCIAWTMALECPDTEVVAADISDAALNVAENQGFEDELSESVAKAPTFVKADILSDIPSSFTQFDMILSNPPYVMDKEKVLMRRNVLDHEPHLALFVSDDDPLLFYRAVARWADRLLRPSGTGIVEINEALGPETALVFNEAGFAHTEIFKDFNERNRFVLFRR